MKRVRYLVRISKDPKWTGAPPCRTCRLVMGKTIDTALRRSEQAITLHLRGIEDGVRIPGPGRRTTTPRRTPRRVDFYATVEVAA